MNTSIEALLYSVNFWASHPDAGNDDCLAGSDFATLEEARRLFTSPVDDDGIAYIELDGPNVHQVRQNPTYAKPFTDDNWRQEQAMEAGMLHGVQAYNEVLGSPVEFSETPAGRDAREEWARGYDELNGAPEGPDDY
jgi:hypothetical protein